jgi:hypothetical protein
MSQRVKIAIGRGQPNIIRPNKTSDHVGSWKGLSWCATNIATTTIPKHQTALSTIADQVSLFTTLGRAMYASV